MVLILAVIISGCIEEEPVDAPFNHSDDQDIFPTMEGGLFFHLQGQIPYLEYLIYFSRDMISYNPKLSLLA